MEWKGADIHVFKAGWRRNEDTVVMGISSFGYVVFLQFFAMSANSSRSTSKQTKTLTGAQTISEAYHESNKLYQKVKSSTLASSSTEYHDLIKDAARSVLKVNQMVETLALFSDNETLRDISSVNLKYLMCDYMYGYLFLNLHDQNHREICIREGLGAVRKFLSRVEDLELMSEQ
eukprot:263823-Amorphochlora_amoeboformis.AAC.1